MATQTQFEHEDIAAVPRGWKVRTMTQKDGARVRVAFPPGPRQKGSGKLISILHPKGNPKSWSGYIEFRDGSIKYTKRRPSRKAALLSAARAVDAHPDWKPDIRTYGAEAENPTKSKTREQLEAMKAKAVKFLRDVAHAPAKADEIENLSVDDYAAKKKLEIANPRRRRNQDEPGEAARLYKEFHGKSAKEILEVQDADIARDTYTVLGGLYEMKFKLDGQAYTLSFKDCGVKLGSSADGNQLYVLGGDQDCEKLLPKPDSGKDLVDLGTITHISYVTRKGFDGFKESIYQHKFGEEGGKPPGAWYARLAKRILIGGGDYRVEAPGIIN